MSRELAGRDRVGSRRRDQRLQRIEPGDLEVGNRLYGTEPCAEDAFPGLTAPSGGRRSGAGAGGDQASITRRAASSNHALAASAGRDLKTTVKDYWDRQRVVTEDRRLKQAIRDAGTDEEFDSALAAHAAFVRQHGLDLATAGQPTQDPRMIRAPGDNWVAPPRQIPGVTRSALVGRTSGGAGGSETMSGAATRDGQRRPNTNEVWNEINRRFWQR